MQLKFILLVVVFILFIMAILMCQTLECSFLIISFCTNMILLVTLFNSLAPTENDHDINIAERLFGDKENNQKEGFAGVWRSEATGGFDDMRETADEIKLREKVRHEQDTGQHQYSLLNDDELDIESIEYADALNNNLEEMDYVPEPMESSDYPKLPIVKVPEWEEMYPELKLPQDYRYAKDEDIIDASVANPNPTEPKQVFYSIEDKNISDDISQQLECSRVAPNDFTSSHFIFDAIRERNNDLNDVSTRWAYDHARRNIRAATGALTAGRRLAMLTNGDLDYSARKVWWDQNDYLDDLLVAEKFKKHV